MHTIRLYTSILAFLCGVAMTAASAQQPDSTKALDKVQRLELGQPIERQLQGGQMHPYQFPLRKGQFLKAAVRQQGIDVLIRLLAPGGSQLAQIDTPNGDQGDEPIRLEAPADGLYRIEVSSLEKEAKPGRYRIWVDEVLSASVYMVWKADSLRQQQAVIGWLKTHAIPLKTVEAGHDFADLQPLKQVLKDVRMIGLGEATHGTREFFQVKHRLLEFLVREMNYRVFALEGSYSALQVINDYVMGRMDDGTKALDGQGFAVWNTEEIRTLLDWARQYNAGVPANQRVKFTGFDMQVNKPGKERLGAYIKRTAPEWANRLDSLVAVDEETRFNLAYTQSDTDEGKAAAVTLKALKQPYNELYAFLESNRAALIAKSSAAEWEQMHEYARMLVQFMDMVTQADPRQGPATRDRNMAANFSRLIDREPAGTRVVIWAHNSHVATDDNGSFKPIGAYLRQTYGRAYYALGLIFNQGAFQASNTVDIPSKRIMRQFTVKPSPVNTVEWYLAQPAVLQTGGKNFVVDFRSGTSTGAIRTWLDRPRLLRSSIGWYFQPEYEPYLFEPITISKLYDGLLFIETTTRARPNPSVKSDLRGDK